ncbi:hypothetical protein A3C60_02260 [Candidatus Nomurabacteria bacterium RIFCSPHIGHO2_02_FULL_37_45]|uniref:Uncharacterized protein n=1 Tax=Candidatus Nomurabacteria bacterium RIFCSPHIGHO2_12_FULL_37_29 TaxID=1801759 RepID=A0A1F6WBG9_9BACT|nr:MAG: hypothetical protein A2727_00310 [Candidatus Nomurabacteria bacterium RIFCSPHIGHO2_01_FULL_37_110]OGI70904.1 MAG: hypothetical protein A3C60_02260 [Candidatus Nomurabacteria bacterium RIFCSPHIGHO2_02_FULL_37_45]OGI79172.1 MAG: hypothetical protein A3F19_00155 [Candidatus Nomurabacteria bacterium RIFCSPHIGHO2_12_FULL_37_29]OGI84492.1 MAG: hypothetical protein A3A92_01800 [Candidatus Nomurabacteria bacterium RIFCSPLOWO2_01_FULL_37_49]
MANEKKKNDFDEDKITQRTEQHDKDISGITDRLSALENKLKPDQVALLLESAEADSKKLDTLFSKLFCNMLDKDPNVKIAITNRLKTVDRDSVKSFWKKFGFTIWSIALIILGAVAYAMASKYIH